MFSCGTHYYSRGTKTENVVPPLILKIKTSTQAQAKKSEVGKETKLWSMQRFHSKFTLQSTHSWSWQSSGSFLFPGRNAIILYTTQLDTPSRPTSSGTLNCHLRWWSKWEEKRTKQKWNSTFVTDRSFLVSRLYSLSHPESARIFQHMSAARLILVLMIFDRAHWYVHVQHGPLDLQDETWASCMRLVVGRIAAASQRATDMRSRDCDGQLCVPRYGCKCWCHKIRQIIWKNYFGSNISKIARTIRSISPSFILDVGGVG